MRKRRNQKKIPTPKTEVGKNQLYKTSLVCVAAENEQHCVTGVINSLQQPVFTVSLRSIDNPLVCLAYFHNFYRKS